MDHSQAEAIGFVKEAVSGEKLLTIGGLALGATGTGLGVMNTIRNHKDSRDMKTMRQMRGAADDMLAASVYQAQGGRIAPQAGDGLRKRYMQAREGFQAQFPEG